MVKGNSRFLLAEQDGLELTGDCSSSTAYKSEQCCIRGALCREMSKYLSALCLGITRLIQGHCDAGKVERDTLN